MNIQILGIRSFIGIDKDTGNQKEINYEAFWDKNYRAPSVKDILANPSEFLKSVPVEERYNLYFTVGECLEEKGRKLLRQTIVPFDIDGIDKSKITETYHAACAALGFIPEKVGAIFSGNGIWLFVNSSEEITDENYFEQKRIYYKELCHKINEKLKAQGLAGKADPTCWSAARLARYPETENRKKNKETARAYVLNPVVEEVLDIVTASGLPVLGKEDQLTKDFMRAFPSPDAKEILDQEKGCKFLAHCKENPNEISEEQWYAMLGITDWLPSGRDVSHEYSRGYRGYSHAETERKADQAKQNSGPRTCKNINQIWGKCGGCKHFNRVTSPVQIRGADFIVTEKTGFWSFKQTKDGLTIRNKPEVMDLVKYFKRKHTFVSVPETKELFIYNGKHWEEKHTSYLQIYAKEHFDPYVPTYVYDEFAKNVLLTNSVPRNWFHNTTAGKFNLQNGVYDMHTGELKPHSSEFGFTHILPYEYDPSALCPTFDKFMKDVTKEREDLTQALLEYVGYGLSNDECWLQKAVILTGSGANGKSTFCDVIRGLAGKNNVAAQRLERLGNPVVNALIQNKLINISEETGAGAFFSAEDFKELVAGGSMNVKQLYKNQYEVLNRTKFMILCNELPTATDGSHGFFRRLVIVPFDARFDEGNRDPFIKDKLLTELAGIFNIVVKHYKALVERGVLATSNTVTKTIENYKYDSDIAASWAHDHFEYVPNSPREKWVATVEVYQEYAQNCQYDWGVKPVSIVKFWKKMEMLFRQDFHDKRVNIRKNGKQQWFVKGLVRKELPDESF